MSKKNKLILLIFSITRHSLYNIGLKKDSLKSRRKLLPIINSVILRSMPGPPPGSHGQPDPSQKIMFDVLIIPLFPSVVCFIFLFYNFIRNRQIRMKPTNRFFIYLLIISSIQVCHISSNKI
jgi:hypothetical protein